MTARQVYLKLMYHVMTWNAASHKIHFVQQLPCSGFYGDLKVAVDVFWCRPFGRGQNWSAQVYWKQCDKSMFHPRHDNFNSIFTQRVTVSCKLQHLWFRYVLHIYFIFAKIAPRWQCFVLFRSCACERSRSARFLGFCRSFQNAAERSQSGGRMQGIWLYSWNNNSPKLLHLQ